MNNTNITNISLGLGKKKFTIDGDENKVIYLDPSDMGILPRIKQYSTDAETILGKLKNVTEEELVDKMTEVDKELREAINTLFDYDVCSVCVPKGTLFDPMAGQFKFEIIVDGLSKVYADTITTEMQAVTKKMSEHTKKYTNKPKAVPKKK